ncbi:hypothetical protein SAMN06297229_0968 [Pseudidiomarina planktonica]|uniref:Uncharacterized protein n=1 Tax=Pseudidiomarina planktonica TaxID=1323738 RepID=A0A1Y6ENA7_9GAMM|nr:DUF6088 family protein [Pseudidiomarina planktonica]RUO65607.1 hypothetical protein CWI77_03920 [Pseudidiomarina planktonica]SMQ64138.1 hypothetical protein SAMN06297229_0968 [Pseudidiomarina planktonica]
MQSTLTKSGVAQKVHSYVKHQQLGKPFTIGQLAVSKMLKDDERATASKALQRLVKDNSLKRAAYGTYYRPKVSKFGMLPLEAGELVKVIKKTKMATVVPAGVEALNSLGLDTQLPMARSYYISERTRSHFKSQAVKFEYKETLQYFTKRFKVSDKEKHKLGLLFWSALTYLDKKSLEHYNSKLVKKFYQSFDSKTQQKFMEALPPSLNWAKEVLS